MSRGDYTAIDVHAAQAPAWPAQVPALTADEAVAAARRLYRFALGRTFTGKVIVTTGNRRAFRLGWEGNTRAIYVNPTQGWRDFVHGASHWLDFEANGRSRHDTHHARFEAKLVREVIRRGWLDGKLRDTARAPKAAPTLDDKRRAKLARIEAAVDRWERKAKRAKTALTKLARQQRYYTRVLGIETGGTA